MTHVYIVYQIDMDDDSKKDVVDVYTSLAVAQQAAAQLWADPSTREVYGEDNNPFIVEGRRLLTSCDEEPAAQGIEEGWRRVDV